MKKIVAILLALTMLALFCACDEPVCGGWIEAEDKTVTIKLKDIFDKAIAEYDGVALEPVELIATQVVAGTNYKFLCKGTPVTEEPVEKKFEVIIYKDLEGSCSVSTVVELEK